MPELRKDPVVGRWVIIATERARRPGNFVEAMSANDQEDDKKCRFCLPQSDILYQAVRANRNGVSSPWDVCVVPFKSSFLQKNIEYYRQKNGLYDVMSGFGTHEVIVETPEHVANVADLDVEQIECVLKTYVHRIEELERNDHFQFILAFKNYGAVAGSRNIDHSRSHIIATPVNPLRVKQKLRGAKKYYETNKSCVYCDLIRQELADKSRVILETEYFLAITPFAARFLFEVWILPKVHHCDFTSGVEGKEKDLAMVLKELLQRFKIGLDDPAYNYYIQTAPFRRLIEGEKRWATIEEDFHWHIELMPRLTRIAGFEKGTGFYISAVPPEHMAEYLRQVEV